MEETQEIKEIDEINEMYKLDETENESPKEEDNEDASDNQSSGKLGAIIFFILSAISLGIGLYKLWAYENNYSQVNAYVGGDAYNYIINSNLATAYFTLAVLFTLIALGYLIIGAIKMKK